METELEVHLSSLRLVNEKLDKVLLVKSDTFQLALWVSRQLVPSEILALRTEILRTGLWKKLIRTWQDQLLPGTAFTPVDEEEAQDDGYGSNHITDCRIK
ncbi:hypothetical protein HGM15179_006507 [Zosterops borbonicus]|uniref:Uncharacterized protein n=1 Tax=Zosterops borbonicus TaxID=364589 RepID=A0A8K1GKI2_9PASS|nr:hypothetical protein HGM15179_006507 [Zosterops borbonicus]